MSGPCRAALAAARTALASLDAALAAVEASLRDDDDDLVELAGGAYGLAGSTLVRWGRGGRLRAFEAERGKLVAWRSDLRAAIEAQPARQVRAVERDAEDPIERALASGELARTR